MKNFSNKTIWIFLVIALPFIFSCSDSGTNSSDLKSGLAGTWTVVRTLVTPSKDFPNGYQDTQSWKFAVNGDNATLTTKDGSINGTWTTSKDFNYNHWVFEATGNDPLTGLLIKIQVEIIAVDKLKGTNTTYWYESMNGMWLLLDSFSIVGSRS